ncbi:MAG: SDR family oxidoreductase [Ferruginibacter sp.]
MILVTGATGHFGKAAIIHLLKKNVPANCIAALVRDEAKLADLKEKGITIRKGDYDDYASLVKAFTGVDKLLLVSASDISSRSVQQANAVKAAKEAGVPYILYTSFERKNETASSPIAAVAKAHIETEKNILAAGIGYTFFRNNLYTDFIPVFAGEKVLETGLFWPSGNGRIASVTRDEMAEAASNVLTSEGHEGKTYRISNITNISFEEVAEIISNTSGKTVPFINPDEQAYKTALTAAGVPAVYVDLFASFATAIKQGEFESTGSDLEKLLGRKPQDVADYLKKTYQQ